MSDPAPILVTGSAGRIGRSVVAELVRAGHAVRGFDRVASPGLPAGSQVVGTLESAADVTNAFTGVRAVVHLAAAPDDVPYPRRAPPDDGDNFESQLLPANVLGAYRVFEAARKLGVKRLVVASSVQAVDELIQPGATRIPGNAPPKPRYLYACTKVFLEALGEAYSREHLIDVMAVRLGWCPRDAAQAAEVAASELAQDLYLSGRDAGRFFRLACEADWRGGHVVTVTSRPARHELFDLSLARELVGYEPADAYPAGLEEVPERGA